MATMSSGSMRPDRRDVLEQVGGVEQLLARRLRRRPAVVRIGEEPLQQCRVDSSPAGADAVAVEGLGPATRRADRGIDQGVGRTDVEGQRRRAAADDRDVGDPAEVERPGDLVRPAEQQFVERAGQRCTMPAGGDVARPHVGDDWSAGCFGDPGRLAELQTAAGPALGIDPVEDRLAVRHDEVDRTAAEAIDGRPCRLGERLADERVQPADLLGRRRRRWHARRRGLPASSAA